MPEGFSTATANSVLDAIGNNTSYAVASLYVQLHIGAPGSAGTANQATETTRKLVSFGAAAAGSMANDTAITWTAIAGSQDATHASFWTASSGGTFVASGTITAGAYTAGQNYTVAIGQLTLSLPVAS